MTKEMKNKCKELGIDFKVQKRAAKLWNDMHSRCYNTKLHERCPSYATCTICDEWLEDRIKFYEWVKDNYYTIGLEQMDLDKDILVKGNKVYSPSTCIFVPHSINMLFTNGKAVRNNCPVGVHYDKYKGKYRVCMAVDGRNVKLHSWGTPEEAFAEYKQHKEALIMVTADKYKGKIPTKLYNAMINWKVEITD
ncbi:MAG: hypothetical protein LUC97_06420 [Clostridiales bacterium]|nr:hypothetical protein [Clostridiales bacterium]